MIRKRTIFLFLLLYLLLLFAGSGIIYGIHYYSHRPMTGNAKHAASELAESDSLSDPSFYFEENIYYIQGEHLQEILSSSPHKYADFEQCAEKYKKAYDTQSSFYTLTYDLTSGKYIALAAEPVYKGGIFIGEVYVARIIIYLKMIMITFLVLTTFLYGIIMIFLYLIHRKNQKIEQIYHTYIANVSHELKTPVASIQALTETLAEGCIDDEETISRYYGIILNETQRLQHTITDIIHLSKMEDRRADFSKKEVFPKQIAEKLLNHYVEFCDVLSIDFGIDPSFSECPPLHTNPERLLQLLEILCDNAVKFTSEGGKITICATQEKQKMLITVQDTGIGIPEKDLPHIFERFYRSNAESNPSGSGLGLAIAAEIIESLGEKIRVESRYGEGTAFSFTISLWQENKKTVPVP